MGKVTQVFNSNRGREFEVSQGYIKIPCLKKKEKCTRLCRKIMFACSSQIPATPLLMVHSDLLVSSASYRIQPNVGLDGSSRNFNVRASLAYEMSSQNQVQFKGIFRL